MHPLLHTQLNSIEGIQMIARKVPHAVWAKMFKITSELGNPRYRYLMPLIQSVIILMQMSKGLLYKCPSRKVG